MESSHTHVPETSKPAAPSAAPAARRGSPLRLGILLLILAACIGALAYDYKVAKPGSEAANEKIKNLVEIRNSLSVAKAGPVTSADIRKELGRAPTWVEEKPTHTIEWYCWWGKMPLLSTRRHFVTVLYIGEKRRFSAQQLNGPPAADDLPTHFQVEDVPTDVGPLEPPVGATAGGGPGLGMPGMAPAMPGMGPGKGGKGKGKGKTKSIPIPGSSDPSPATEPKAGDAPSTSEPATDKPSADTPAAEKPAPDGEKPPDSAAKPVEDKPATEEPKTDKPE